ncbi:MAG: glycosyltransferase [Candidatus Dormibacteria bacterium]
MSAATLRVLYASHSLALDINRRRLDALAPLVGRLDALAPTTWRHERLGEQPAEPGNRGGYDLHLLPRIGPARPARFLYANGALRRLLDQVQPGLVHAELELHSLGAIQLAWVLAGRVPLVLSISENRPGKLPAALRLMARWVARRAAMVSFVAPEVRDSWRGIVEPLRSSILPQGHDPTVFRPGAERDRPGIPFTAGFFGRLVPEKGPQVLVEALAQLDDAFRLRINDFGPGRAQLEQQAARLGVTSRIDYLTVSHGEVPAALASLDAVAVPSLSTPRWAEQFGRVPIEAMACGIPVVAAASGSLPSTVGGAGMLVAEGDATALAHALRELRDDPALWSRMRVSGIEWSKRFTWDAVARATVEAYATVL